MEQPHPSRSSRPCLTAILSSSLRPRSRLSSRLSWQGRELSDPQCLDGPVNLELATAMSRCVRRAGVVPATVAIMDGQWHVGGGPRWGRGASITSIAA